MKAPRETDLVRTVLDYLALRRIPAWRSNSGAMKVRGAGGKERFVRFSGARGCADVLGLLPPSGRFLAVECKLGRNRPTADQQHFLDAAAAAAAIRGASAHGGEFRGAAAPGANCRATPQNEEGAASTDNPP